MEVFLESEEQMGRNKQKGRGKRQRPAGPPAPSPAVVADQTGRLLAEREREWLERLTTNPASFAAVELEVHEQTRRQADLYVAGLLAKASEQPEREFGNLSGLDKFAEIVTITGRRHFKFNQGGGQRWKIVRNGSLTRPTYLMPSGRSSNHSSLEASLVDGHARRTFGR